MPKVIVYSTPTCPFCMRTKNFLKEHNIEFEDIDASADRAKAEEMIRKSGQTGVPVIDIDGNIVIGYNVARLKELLNIK